MADENAATEAETQAGNEATNGEGTITLPDGKKLSAADVVALQAGNLRQSDYTKKTMALADERKVLEAERNRLAAEIEALRAKATSSAPAVQPTDGLDQYVPGLTGKFSEIQQSINDLTKAQQTFQAETHTRIQQAEAEEKMEATLDGYEARFGSLVNRDELRAAIQESGLPLEKSDYVFSMKYGFKLGELAKENALARRSPTTPAPMRSTPSGLTATVAQEVPTAEKPIGQQSWQDRKRMAMADPRRPRG